MHKIISTLFAITAIGAVVAFSSEPGALIRGILIGAVVFVAYWTFVGLHRLVGFMKNGPVMIVYRDGRGKRGR